MNIYQTFYGHEVVYTSKMVGKRIDLWAQFVYLFSNARIYRIYRLIDDFWLFLSKSRNNQKSFYTYV